jgi:hypothetical protein
MFLLLNHHIQVVLYPQYQPAKQIKNGFPREILLLLIITNEGWKSNLKSSNSCY